MTERLHLTTEQREQVWQILEESREKRWQMRETRRGEGGLRGRPHG